MDKDAVIEGVERLRRIDKESIKQIIDAIPGEWQVTGKARAALIQLVLQRAAFVADTIYEKLWLQKELKFTDGPED